MDEFHRNTKDHSLITSDSAQLTHQITKKKIFENDHRISLMSYLTVLKCRRDILSDKKNAPGPRLHQWLPGANFSSVQASRLGQSIRQGCHEMRSSKEKACDTLTVAFRFSRHHGLQRVCERDGCWPNESLEKCKESKSRTQHPS